MKTNNYTRFLVPSFQWRWLCSLLILLGFSITVTRAQLAVNYPLTISSGTYSSISGTGTLVSAMAADTYHENVTGLTGFTVNGVTYNNVRMSSNGWLVLYGATAPATTTTTPLSTAITNGGVALAPFAADLTLSSGGGCAFYRQDTGTELVFEWMNYSRYSFSGSNDVLNFQVRLNYSTGVISFVYGTCTAGSNPTSSPQVGWKTTPTTAANWNSYNCR